MKLHFMGAQHLPKCDIHVASHFPQLYVIHLAYSGSFYFQKEDGRHTEIAPPFFFWTQQNTQYQYGPGSTGDWDHHWISFQGQWAEGYYQPLLERMAPAGWVPVHNADSLKALFLNLIQQLNQAGSSTASHLHTFNHLLSQVHAGLTPEIRKHDPVEQIKKRLDDNPQQHHELAKLAKEHGISYSYFRKTFRDRYHDSPHHYQLDQRMRLAARMLANQNTPIKEVGSYLGYEEASRFSRVFKDHYSMSPLNYRKSLPLASA